LIVGTARPRHRECAEPSPRTDPSRTAGDPAAWAPEPAGQARRFETNAARPRARREEGRAGAVAYLAISTSKTPGCASTGSIGPGAPATASGVPSPSASASSSDAPNAASVDGALAATTSDAPGDEKVPSPFPR